MLIELSILSIWILLSITAFHYLRYLFGQLKLDWSWGSSITWGVICLSGPAAIVCAVVVDWSRPL